MTTSAAASSFNESFTTLIVLSDESKARSPARNAGDEISSRTRITELFPLPYRHVDCFRTTAAQHFHWNRFAHCLAAQGREQTICIVHRLTTHGNENITHQQASLFGGTTFLEPQHQQPVSLFTSESLARRVRNIHRLGAHTEIAAFDRSMFRQRIGHPPRHFDRYRQRRTTS